MRLALLTLTVLLAAILPAGVVVLVARGIQLATGAWSPTGTATACAIAAGLGGLAGAVRGAVLALERSGV